MKKIIIGLLSIISISSFAKTIQHDSCRLFTGFVDQELIMILENKGYEIYYSDKLESNSLLLRTSTVTSIFDSHPLSVMACPAQHEKWTKFKDIATIYRFDGAAYMMLATDDTTYQACQQSGGVKKSERSIKRLLRKLPNCEIK
jgi:hypothetical protein